MSSRTVFACRVDGVPVPKGRPRVTMRGRFPTAYTPKATVEWERCIADQVRAIVASREGPWEALEASYRVSVEVRRKHKRGDLDNFVKAVTDALNGILWPDDRMIFELRAWMIDGQTPGVSIVVERDL